ncbi:MAG: BPSS1780 family membrane protein [Formosimonas sp.]|jgi:hypothetical protein
MTTEQPTAPSFNIARLPIAQAFSWLDHGFRLLKAQPWTLLSSVSWILLVSILLAQINSIGFALAALIWPAMAFGMADVTQKIRLQHQVQPLDVFSGFNVNHRTRLLTLGVLLAILPAILSVAVQRPEFSEIWALYKDILSTNKPAENFAEFQSSLSQMQATLESTFLSKPKLLQFAAWFELLLFANLALMLLAVYSPMFVVWQNTSAPRALLLSATTVLKNFLPIGLLLIIVSVGGLVGLTVVVAVTQFIPLISIWALLAFAFMFSALVYCVIFASYHNIIMTSLPLNAKKPVAEPATEQ